MIICRIAFAVLVSAASLTTNAQIEKTFDSDGGCLNVIDFSSGRGIGASGDNVFTANYLHEKFINEQFSMGAGIGYSYHKKYRFSAIPVYLSTHYFFLDKQFSPFANLRIGGFCMFGEKEVDTRQKYSISSKKPEFNLYVSPSIGIKAHITPNIGVTASLSDDVYLVNAFDAKRNDYRIKLTHTLGISIGVCFQIKGW